MERLKLYLKDSYDELMTKVSWPTWTELQETAVIVVVFTVIFSLMILAMDQVGSLVLNTFYSLFK